MMKNVEFFELKLNQLESEKSKLMAEANDYSQAKAALDSEIKRSNGTI